MLVKGFSKATLFLILFSPVSALYAAYPSAIIRGSDSFIPVDGSHPITLEQEVVEDFPNTPAPDTSDTADTNAVILDGNTETDPSDTIATEVISPEDEVVLHDDNIMVFPPVNVYSNEIVERYVKMYTEKKRRVLDTGLSRYGQYMPLMLEIFSQYNLPPELVQLAIVESNLNPKAISPASAVGIWQFIASTGRNYGLNSNFYIDDRLNVEKATHAAANHLRDLFATFKDWEHALAAYNSGAGTVRRAIRKNLAKGKPIDFWNLSLPRETRGYVPAFLAINIIIKNPDKYGVSPKYLDLDKRPSFSDNKKVSFPPSIKFEQIEQKLGIDKSIIAMLNPEYKMGLTPPENRRFSLAIPANYNIPENYYDQFKTDKIPNLMVHQVRKGETLSGIAAKYRTSTSTLMRLNPRVKSRSLQIGHKLVVAVSSSPKITYTSKNNQSVYQVSRGDTLKSISDYFGIKLSTLLSLNKNNVSIAQPLVIGTVLQIE